MVRMGSEISAFHAGTSTVLRFCRDDYWCLTIPTPGSGGDALPWYFRKMKIGPLVGKRTWGGLVASFPMPQLMDGGNVTAPDAAIYGLEGEWEVENRGVAPDVEVEMDPAAWREGRDPQLERAVELVLEEMKRNPKPRHKRPAYPNYQKPAESGGRGNN